MDRRGEESPGPSPNFPRYRASSPCAMSVSKILTATFERRPDLVLIRRELRSDGVAFLEVRDSYSRDSIQLRPFAIPCHQESRAANPIGSRLGLATSAETRLAPNVKRSEQVCRQATESGALESDKSGHSENHLP